MITIPKAMIISMNEKGDITECKINLPGKMFNAINRLEDDDCKVHLTIGKVKKARTIRQLNAAHGWCQDIAEQLGFDTDYIYGAMKRMAVAEGYPTRYNYLDGKEEPESSAAVSVEQYNILLKVIQLYADTHGLYLTEIVDGSPIKTVGGAK